MVDSNDGVQDSKEKLKSHIMHASEESSRIINEGKRRGIVLRLVGGLAIHKHCAEHHFCDRSHGDLDFVGKSSQYDGIVQIMRDVGYVEDTGLTLSTGGTRLLFEKPSTKEHIDVFLDRIDIEHLINLKDCLSIEVETLSVSDLLLLKLTISRFNEKDVRDIVSLLKDLPLGHDDSPGIINIDYIAELCAKDWGFHHEVTAELRRVYHFFQDTPYPRVTTTK